MRIGDLKAHIGEEAELTVFLTDANESVNRNNHWLDLMVCDKTGSTTLKLWAEAMLNSTDVLELIGKPVVVAGQIDLWQDRGGMNVISIREAEEGAYKMSDFFASLNKEDETYLLNRLEILIGLVSSDEIRSLLQTIFSESRRKKMVEKCGGTNHHTYFGGLIAHLVQTAELAKAAADMYGVAGPYRSKVNTDYVIAGALLHDVGKLTTLSDIPGKLSDRGFNLDVPTESVLYTTMFNNKVENKIKDLAPLDHIILACGNVKPRSLEAIIVRNADMMSNQVDAYGLVFFQSKKIQRGGTISYSKELGAYLLKGED